MIAARCYPSFPIDHLHTAERLYIRVKFHPCNAIIAPWMILASIFPVAKLCQGRRLRANLKRLHPYFLRYDSLAFLISLEAWTAPKNLPRCSVRTGLHDVSLQLRDGVALFGAQHLEITWDLRLRDGDHPQWGKAARKELVRWWMTYPIWMTLLGDGWYRYITKIYKKSAGEMSLF